MDEGRPEEGMYIITVNERYQTIKYVGTHGGGAWDV
jgi:hypothetical protein